MTYLTTHEQTQLCQIYCSQGVQPSAAKQIMSEMARYEKSYGIHFLMDRLKLLRRALIVGSNAGIRVHPGGRWWGPFGALQRLASRGRRGAVKADRLLRVYSRWISPEATEEDFDAFRLKLNSTAGSTDFVTDLPIKIKRSDRVMAKRIAATAVFSTYLPTSQVKKVPFTQKTEAETIAPEHLELLVKHCPTLVNKHRDFFLDYVYGSNDTAARHRFATEIVNRLTMLHFRANFQNGPPVLPNSPGSLGVVGRIVCLTKDGGLKKRFIANPHRLLQHATSRLQSALDAYLKTMPESLVHSQELSESWAVGELRAGKRLFSLDLSSATDHFPRQLQLNVLRQLFPELKRDIDLWADICSSAWKDQFDGTTHYLVGQPMGTSPSFAAFTVTHVHLLRWLGGNSTNFRVIGDDVLVSCPVLAQRYIASMKRLGVSVNLSKSLLDSSVAEFAGRTIDIHGYWQSFKASPINVMKDPMGAFRQYGPSGAALVPREFRKKLVAFSKLPLIGPRSCWDRSVLDNLDPIAVDDLYRSKPEPYAVTLAERRAVSTWINPVTFFEECQVGIGFLGSSGFRNPQLLTEHVNSNLRDGPVLSGHVATLAALLTRGPTPDSHGGEVHQPYAFVRKIYKLLHRSLL